MICHLLYQEYQPVATIEAIYPFGPSTRGQPHAGGPGAGYEPVGTGAEDRERSDCKDKIKGKGPPMATAFSRSLRALAPEVVQTSAMETLACQKG